jgi:hypothetical protein
VFWLAGLENEPHSNQRLMAAEALGRKESRGDDQKPCKRAQKERERIGCGSTGPLEKGTCEAPSYEVSKRACDEETDASWNAGWWRILTRLRFDVFFRFAVFGLEAEIAPVVYPLRFCFVHPQ